MRRRGSKKGRVTLMSMADEILPAFQVLAVHLWARETGVFESQRLRNTAARERIELIIDTYGKH